MTVPINKARIKCLVEEAPMSRRAKSIKIMVKELFRERMMVSVIAWLITGFSLTGLFLLNSLILSKTTMVSWTENERVVKTAVTNRRST